MGNFDWSEDQLARNWAEGMESVERLEHEGVLPRGETAALGEGVLRCLNGALLKVAEALDGQARLRRELDTLRAEHALAVRARDAAESLKDRRITNLEGEVKSLRRSLSRQTPSNAPTLCPPDAFLGQPMVILSTREQYLGVCDKVGQALSVLDFLRIIEVADPERLVCTNWESAGDGWLLNIGMTWRGARSRAYGLEAASVRTPSGNRVTLLRRMTVDGRPVPHGYLMRMFRQLRDGIQV